MDNIETFGGAMWRRKLASVMSYYAAMLVDVLLMKVARR